MAEPIDRITEEYGGQRNFLKGVGSGSLGHPATQSRSSV